MRLRNVKNAENIVKKSKYVITNPEDYIGNFSKLFNNDNEIHLEIGMGKGDFLIGMAQKYPNINFIGIELYESVMVRAVQKLDNLDIPNLRLINMDAHYLSSIFNKEISTIYLNFSDPWPKKRHAKRRLTSEVFLSIYDKIFKSDNHIVLKTDNTNLFSYSLCTLSENGYIFKAVSLDLANEDIPNVETEYEKKFKSKGIRINYLDAIKK